MGLTPEQIEELLNTMPTVYTVLDKRTSDSKCTLGHADSYISAAMSMSLYGLPQGWRHVSRFPPSYEAAGWLERANLNLGTALAWEFAKLVAIENDLGNFDKAKLILREALTWPPCILPTKEYLDVVKARSNQGQTQQVAPIAA
jgi:hypothetical protein